MSFIKSFEKTAVSAEAYIRAWSGRAERLKHVGESKTQGSELAGAGNKVRSLRQRFVKALQNDPGRAVRGTELKRPKKERIAEPWAKLKDRLESIATNKSTQAAISAAKVENKKKLAIAVAARLAKTR